MRRAGTGGPGSQNRTQHGRPAPSPLAGVAWALAPLAASLACAHVEAPPGGPVDTIPPVLIATRPESLSVVPGFRGAVRFEFDERISERDVERSVLLAPAPGGVKVDKGRGSVEVEPRRGWQRDRIYHATLLPLVQDLFGNRIREPLRLVFSTGLEIPSNSVAGRVIDPLTGRGVRDVRVEARWLDEELSYLAATDTAGAFRLSRIPPGDYLWVAFEDRNRNLAPDPFERMDSLRMTVGAADTVDLRFRILEPDATPPVLGAARLTDSITVVLDFDDPLDPDFPSDSVRASVRAAPDGPAVAVERAWHAFEYAQARAAEDTAPRPPRRPAPPRVEAPLPQRSLYLQLARPLEPGTYEVRVSRVRNLHGLEGGGTATFEVKPPPAPPEPPREPPPPDPPPDRPPPERGVEPARRQGPSAERARPEPRGRTP